MRKTASALLALLVILSFSSPQAYKTVKDDQSIVLSVYKGVAPLTVTITGPDFLVGAIDTCRPGGIWGQFGFDVNWGDGTPAMPQPPIKGQPLPKCSISHTYTVPGKYNVSFRYSTPDPEIGCMDCEIGHESKAVELEIMPKPDITPATKVRITQPTGTQTAYWGEDFPMIYYDLETNQKVQIRIELVKDDDGSVLDTTSQMAGFNGSDKIWFHHYAHPDLPDEYYKNGPFNTHVRLSALVNEKTVAQDIAGPFIVTPIARFNPLKIVQNANTVTLRRDKEWCYSYILEWGDGTTDQEDLCDKSKPIPTLTTPIEFKHTYLKPGKYEITFYDNHRNSTEPVRKRAGYRTTSVVIDEIR
jgi:hypothetical protein